MDPSELPDRTLHALANGAAEQELQRRRVRREEQAEREERRKRERAKNVTIRSLSTSALRDLAADPRTMDKGERERAWGHLDWSGPWRYSTKDEAVKMARAELQRRRDTVKAQQPAGETGVKALLAAFLVLLVLGGSR